MNEVLFTNVRILDGTGQNPPYAGSVRVRGRQIVQVSRSAAATPAGDALVIDGAGATLMPGMTEAHTHFSWNDAASLAGIQTMPLEEHVLWTAKVARSYLEAGFTVRSMFGRTTEFEGRVELSRRFAPQIAAGVAHLRSL